MLSSPKRIFITGIAGFIGFHLACFLKERGDFVTGCDNFNPYYTPLLKRKRARLLEERGICVLEGDIREPLLIEKTLLKDGISHIVHLAAQAGVRYSLTHPDSYVHNNLDGFVQILEICKRHPHLRFIYASSSSVYGLNEKTPFSENDPTERPNSLYAATKKANELMAHTYHHLYGISTTGLRFFTVYGPWGRPDMAYFSFTRAILKGESISVYNQGKGGRDFTYIDDIIKGTAAAIDRESGCEIFNLGNNSPQSVLQLISLIEEKTGKIARKEFLPMQQGDLSLTFADITKSRSLLGFSPKVSFTEGIEKFVDWYLKEGAALF